MLNSCHNNTHVSFHARDGYRKMIANYRHCTENLSNKIQEDGTMNTGALPGISLRESPMIIIYPFVNLVT